MTNGTGPQSADSAQLTLEAFADTIIPGEKRGPEDRAIAGAATGGGAVAAGALELLHWDATGMSEGVDGLADLLDEHTRDYAAQHDLTLDPSVPAFVALDFEHRTALVQQLTATGHPEREFWILLALFSNMSFDSAAHLHTAEALAAGHPGLTALGISAPDADGLWRFAKPGYGRRLARLHPDTTPSGSPA
jgi:hypothetical protein